MGCCVGEADRLQASATWEETWTSRVLTPRLPYTNTTWTSRVLTPRLPYTNTTWTSRVLTPRLPYTNTTWTSRVLTPRLPYTITTCRDRYCYRPGTLFFTFGMNGCKLVQCRVTSQGYEGRSVSLSTSCIVSGCVCRRAWPKAFRSLYWSGAYVEKYYMLHLAHSLLWFLWGNWMISESHVGVK